MPPTVIFFGTNDKLLGGAEVLVRKGKDLGFKAELYTAEGQPHGFFNRSPWREATLAQAHRFLAAHGYVKGEPAVKVPEKAFLKLAVKAP